MAERIVSPGVFTREKDLSFLPQGIDGIGAALIGPTEEGPAFTPTIVRNFAEFEQMFGKESQDFYVPFAAKQYLRSAGAVTIVRVLGLGGYKNDTVLLGISGSKGVFIGASLKPSRGAADPDALELAGPHSASLNAGGTMNSFVMNLATTNGQSSASREAFTLSFNSGSANYITKVFSTNPQDANQEVYVYKNFLTTQNLMATTDKVFIASGSDENFSFDYDFASTPSIQSQIVNGARTSLFKVKSRSHGTSQNEEYKVGISNIKQPADVPGSDYGSFSLQVIVNNPGQNDDGTVLENFSNLNFDDESTNYLPRVIGDRNITIDSDGKLTTNGDYPNQSDYIYISDVVASGVSKELVPMGFGKVTQPHVTNISSPIPSGSTVAASYPTASLRFTTSGTGQQNTRGTFSSNEYYGFDFANENNKQYLAPLPTSAAVGNNVTMSLEDAFGNNDASTLGSKYSIGAVKISLSGSAVNQRKFAVPFQGGFDGQNPAVDRKVGANIQNTNSQGFD